MAAAVLSAEFYDNVTIKQTHYHDGHQLLFVTGGTATVHVNQTEYCVSAGDLMIFSRLEQHAVTDQSPDYQRFALELSPDLSTLNRDAYRLYAILLNRPAGFCNRVDVRDQQTEFHRMFSAIQQELQHPRTMREEMLELLETPELEREQGPLEPEEPTTQGWTPPEPTGWNTTVEEAPDW